ncbi:MAG: GTPase HflX [Clostridia bacterium]|nr:GTPase HflX [Clostridia bacterium]
MTDKKTVHSDAILVGMTERGADLPALERSLDELARLVDTAGSRTFARVTQIKDSPDPRTLIGAGKVKEIRDLCEKNGVSLVVFDGELSPAQIRNLEDDLGGDVDVIDRSMLILDIFALHAVSGEGKLQVELAQLRYTAPRLVGHGTEMSRLGGGIGTRGPGESKLETDRRHMKERIAALQRQLDELEANRAVMRAARDRSGHLKIALVGYTNAGKSTLLNRLTDAGVLAENKLFATLDPTTRRLVLPSGETVLLTDTVGFIRKLPHHLVKAFRSTLDEAKYADILLIVCDATDPELPEHLDVTRETLASLGASDKPALTVFNHADELPDCPSTGFVAEGDRVFISALTGAGIDLLLAKIDEVAATLRRSCRFLFPYTASGKLDQLYRTAAVQSVEYLPDGIAVSASVDRRTAGELAPYLSEDKKP